MRGSAFGQVKTVMQEIQAFGQSKHSAKEKIRDNLAAQDKAATWHEMGKQLGVHSFLTNNQYSKVSTEAFRYAKENFGLRDLTKIEAQHVQSYLESKVQDGIKYSTLQSYASALEKLETALNKYAKNHNLNKTYSFSEAIQSVRDSASKVLDHTVKAGAFKDSQAVINNIKDETFKTMAEAQYSAGLRVYEMNKITERNFLGDNKFYVERSKGGLSREVTFRSTEVYEKFRDLVSKNGGFIFKVREYTRTVAAAAKLAGEKLTANHSFRHNYARERYSQLRQEGKGELQAKLVLTRELGHSRVDIVNKYL